MPTKNLTKSKGVIAALLAFMLLLPTTQTTQSSPPTPHHGFIRVGLEQYFLERNQITIYSYNLQIGVFCNSLGTFSSTGYLHSSTGRFVATPQNDAFVATGYSFTNLADAIYTAAGYQGGVAALTYNGAFSVYLPSGSQGLAIPPSTSRIALTVDGQALLIADNGQTNLQFRDITGITSLGNRQYRGFMELARFRGQGITAVNIVHMDEYLFSVVPSEMPASWHIEALKAQAVAARTFTLYRMASWAGRDYNLCDTVLSQVYSGVAREHQNTTRAVLETTGLVMLHNGSPILAAYSSCAGGFTANSEDVWFASLPYLRGVAEPFPAEQMLWERTLTLSQLNNLLSTANISIGQATHIELTHNAQGRVMQLTIHGISGTHTLEREHIRTFFAPLQGGALRSRMFHITGAASQTSPPATQTPPSGQYSFVLTATGIFQAHHANLYTINAQGVISRLVSNGHPEAAPANTSQTTSQGYYIHLSGRGWGHGVGMSQHGARAMAEAGHTFLDILNHYYTGVDIVVHN